MAVQAFTLTQLARAAGMSVDQVRFYRDQGLLPPPKRLRGRTDDVGFVAEHLDRLRFIQRALLCGFSVDDIAVLVDAQALLTCNDVYRMSHARLEELRRASGCDDARVNALEELIDTCPGKGGRKDCPILIALAKPPDAQARP
jgi:MerR family copper efflux transcriptional regulator